MRAKILILLVSIALIFSCASNDLKYKKKNGHPRLFNKAKSQ